PLTLNHDMPGTTDDPHFTYTYTPAHQLATLTVDDTDYRWQATGTFADAYTQNNLNQYPTIAWCGGAAQSASWSPNGNLTAAMLPRNSGSGLDSWTYGYDAENRLLTAAKTGLTVNYAYDPLDRRVSRAATGEATVFYLGDDSRDPGSEAGASDEIADYNPDGTLIQRYVPGPAIDQPIATVTAAGV